MPVRMVASDFEVVAMRLRMVVVMVWSCWVDGSEVRGQEGSVELVWEAVEKDDARSLRRHVRSVDSNGIRDSDGQSPLTLAASRGSFECVRELLWGGALADEPNGKGLVAREC